MTIKSTSTLLVIVSFFAGCGLMFRPVTCREYNKSTLNDFPGKVNDTITFSDSDGGIKKFVIADKTINHTTKYISDSGCSCADRTMMLYLSGSDSIYVMRMSWYQYDQPAKEFLEMYFKIDTLRSMVYETMIDSTFNPSQHNGNQFENFKRYINDSIGTRTRINEVFFADNVGLLLLKNQTGRTLTRLDPIADTAKVESFNFLSNECN